MDPLSYAYGATVRHRNPSTARSSTVLRDLIDLGCSMEGTVDALMTRRVEGTAAEWIEKEASLVVFHEIQETLYNTYFVRQRLTDTGTTS